MAELPSEAFPEEHAPPEGTPERLEWEAQKKTLRERIEEAKAALSHPDKCYRLAYLMSVPVEEVWELGGCEYCRSLDNEGQT